jgi:hypothetical protein
VAILFLAFDLWLVLRWLPAGKTSTNDSTADSAPIGGSGPVALAVFAAQDTRGWQTVPRGTQVCDGATFVCDGAIRFGGLRAARDGKNYPGAVLDVPVRGLGSRIHFLQSSENSSGAVEGAPYGRIVLHYTNGETRRFDLLYAVHGRDWMQNPRNPVQPPLDPNTTLGWSELHPRRGTMIRFYHTTFANPLPDVEITSADFVSPLQSANLLLFGFTVDNNPRPLAAPWQSENPALIPPTDGITVILQDAAGRPLPDATFEWSAVALRGQVDFPPMRADAQARVLLEFQQSALRQILYTAHTASGKTLSGELQPDATGRFEPVTRIKLSP